MCDEFTDMWSKTEEELSSLISKRKISARDNKCPWRECFRVHLWQIRGNKFWACGRREKSNCPDPVPAPKGC